ncbi:MAG: SRPBCC family protein [Promicromonosporaceae bacterium]|nr:SRPBCC family protein [Promicromonosporaceae bacterium]
MARHPVPRSAARAGALVALGLGAALLTRRLAQTWGTLGGEHDDELPGDGILPDARLVATRGVGIAAPPRVIWPWLLQLGYGRGGFYSHDRLERLAGLDIRSAERVEERWQGLAVGDEVHLAPAVALSVAEMHPERHLVLAGVHSGPGKAPAPYDFTWAFVLRPVGAGSRVLVRERYRPRGPGGRVLAEVMQPVSFVMTAAMLRGIRQRTLNTS